MHFPFFLSLSCLNIDTNIFYHRYFFVLVFRLCNWHLFIHLNLLHNNNNMGLLCHPMNKCEIKRNELMNVLPTEARAEIVGPPIRYLTPGSTLKLMCRIIQNTETSAFIFWYHDNRMINYDVDRGINVSTEAGNVFISFIFIHLSIHSFTHFIHYHLILHQHTYTLSLSIDMIF